MEEIKENEYVRLENGIILKYGEEQSVKIENNTYTDYSGEYEWSSTVVNHSPNIIDLIEVGDYVNGYKVIDVMEDMQTGELHLEMPMDYINQERGDCTIYNKNIKSIVTKEQFKSIEYIIEED